MQLTKGTICQSCYVKVYNAMRPTLLMMTTINTIVLNNYSVKVCKIPNKFSHVRFNAFSEIENNNNIYNFLSIAEQYPDKTFSIYTKRIFYLEKYLNMYKALHDITLSNLVVIQSAEFLNKKPKCVSKITDRTFTVVFNNGWKTNCPCSNKQDKTKCYDCKACYTKKKNNVRHMVERIHTMNPKNST